MSWLLATWRQVWPNLLASVLWGAPAFFVHYRMLRRHLTRTHGQLKDHLQFLLFPEDDPDAAEVDDQ